MTHSFTGFVHLASAIVALLLGTAVLLMKKGTRAHRMLGYTYTATMLLLNGTAFGLYGLFGTFGPFHAAALMSLTTLFFGMKAALTRKPARTWLLQHLICMYWSVIGLYAAFVSEMLTRIPKAPFFPMVGIAMVSVFMLGAFGQRFMVAKWQPTRR